MIARARIERGLVLQWYYGCMRIGMLQLNPVIGDVRGNTSRMIDAIDQLDAELIVTPEMSICGYPPRDLLYMTDFVHACEEAVQQGAQQHPSKVVVVGHPRIDGATGRVRNSVSVLLGGDVIARYDKQLLPSYDIFDEKRYFEAGEVSCVVDALGTKIGIAICEDFWRGLDAHAAPTYDTNPISDLIEQGCTMIVSPGASPFVSGKREVHLQYTQELAAEHGLIIVATNQVGGNDDLVFDGGSFIASPDGLLGVLPLFETGSLVVDTDVPSLVEHTLPTDDEERFLALRLCVQDYFHKTNHSNAILGLSGGIDSALTATIAVSALGATSVTGVLMPSRYSSRGSIEDAEQLATTLGIETINIPIEHMHLELERTIDDCCLHITGLAGENVQARIRGVLLMAHANEHHGLLLATGNKSELAVGYSTLYGDMAGALSVIGDPYKTDLWSMAKWINGHSSTCGFAVPPIPDSSITKAPSAELRPDQLDQDALPPYDDLDSILRLHIDLDLGIDEIEEKLDLSCDLITQVVQMVDHAQFKRDQAAVILKTSPRSFGRGRRMPIVMQRNWSVSREMT